MRSNCAVDPRPALLDAREPGLAADGSPLAGGCVGGVAADPQDGSSRFVDGETRTRDGQSTGVTVGRAPAFLAASTMTSASSPGRTTFTTIEMWEASSSTRSATRRTTSQT